MTVVLRRIAALGLALAALVCAPAVAHAAEPFSFGYTDDWPENAHFVGPAAQSGAKIGRQFICWCGIEPQPGVYDWRLLDGLASSMAGAGMRPLLVIYGSPGWARSGGGELTPPSPAHDADWRRLFERVAARYPSLAGIEVMNEPNLAKFFPPAADPQRYATLLKLAYAGAKAGNRSLPVLHGAPTGGLTGNGNMRDTDFLQAVYRAGGRGHFDAIAAHPYPEPGGFPFVASVRSQLDGLRFVRFVNGDWTTPIWVTEVGVSSTGHPGPHAHAHGDASFQAEALARIYRALRAMPDVPVGLVFRYSDVLARLNPDPWSAGSGVVTVNGTAKVARQALLDAQRSPAENRPTLSVTATPIQARLRSPIRVIARMNGLFGAAQYQFDLNANGVPDTVLGPSNTAMASFTTPGRKRIGVRVFAFWDSWTGTVDVNVRANERPIAKFDIQPRNGPYRTDRCVIFNPRRSSDPDGSLFGHRWSIARITRARGQVIGTPGQSGRTVLRRRFRTAGWYRVGLVVKDNVFETSTIRTREFQVRQAPRRDLRCT